MIVDEVNLCYETTAMVAFVSRDLCGGLEIVVTGGIAVESSHLEDKAGQ